MEGEEEFEEEGGYVILYVCMYACMYVCMVPECFQDHTYVYLAVVYVSMY